MDVFTYSEARQKQLSVVLDRAQYTGKVLISRKDGRAYALVPEKSTCSPLGVPSIKACVSTKEIVDIVRSGREREELAM
jgi:antitoxin Phd